LAVPDRGRSDRLRFRSWLSHLSRAALSGHGHHPPLCCLDHLAGLSVRRCLAMGSETSLPLVCGGEGGMTAIRVDKVWKEYDDQIVLENISFEIGPRAFLVLVGPSGCGKTTFLRMLLGEEKPTRGAITIDGEPLVAEPDSDRGVVFQRYSVFPHLTALRNVMLGRELEHSPFMGRLFGAKRGAAEDEARALLASVGLAGAEDKYPAALSGGMQQRLALAQALIRRP